MKQNVLIDSHGWIEYFSEGPLISKYAKHIENANVSTYITPSIVLYEVYKRIKTIKGENIALIAISHIIEHTQIFSIDKKISLNAAEISIRTKLPMADSMIKAVAEETNAVIITGDSHFKNMDNVILVE
ncbi:MAG: type II toxin-antitoxin system VapC family toxin [Candidatus Aenigmatarchaeota archaeon]